uniref:Uncharacterized protein n=1 Tax=Romanomermis culicivorax TaxID=13658 RepID=A0A915KBS0_ROMCU
MGDFLVFVYFFVFFATVRFSEELPIAGSVFANGNFTDINAENLPENATLSTGELVYRKVIINPLCNGLGCRSQNPLPIIEGEPVIVDVNNHC